MSLTGGSHITSISVRVNTCLPQVLETILVRPLPFADPALVGGLAIEVREDKVEHFRIPFDGSALDLGLDVLWYGD